MDQVADVDIDPSGVFKYILIELTDDSTKQLKHIVRGYERCPFHGDILDEVAPAIEAKGLKLSCLGGGRINHQPTENLLKLYGYSQGYGKADHTEAGKLIGKKYPDYKITVSDEGY